MFKINNSSIKVKSENSVDYLKEFRNQAFYNNRTTKAVEVSRESEFIEWNCAFCQNIYTINVFNFKAFKPDDFLCKKCADLPKTSALNINIMKSSNFLTMKLKTMMDKNFTTVEKPNL